MSDHLSSLPIDILIHIQSLLNLKESARSAVLCSAMYRSWLNIGSFDFDPSLFSNIDTFWDTSFGILRRCMQHRVKLHRVTIRLCHGPRFYQMYHPVDEFVDAVVKLGASVITFAMLDDLYCLLLPDCLLTSNTVAELSIIGGMFDVNDEYPVVCSSIHTLRVNPIDYLGGRTDRFIRLIMRCPSIRQLECTGFILGCKRSPAISLAPHLHTIVVHDLSYQSSIFYTHTIGLFTSLKSLTLGQIVSHKKIRIRSDSIQTLSLVGHYSAAPVFVGCPRLITFLFEGSAFTRLRFEHGLNWGVSKLNVVSLRRRDPIAEEIRLLDHWNRHKRAWFAGLYRFLNAIACSRIELSVSLGDLKPDFTYDFGHIGEPIHVAVLEFPIDADALMLQHLSRVCEPSLINYG